MLADPSVRSFDTVVIGAGGAGAASAWHLAARGQRVLLLERFHVGHDRGSSHGHSRIFRLAYPEPEYAQLARAALAEWHALERASGLRLLTLTGGLDLGPGGHPGLRGVEDSLSGLGSSFDILDAIELARRFPQWRVPDDWTAVYSPDAGIVDATRTVEVMVAMARAHGAALRERTRVESLDLSDPEAPVVRTDAGTFEAGRVVLAAGAWTGELVPELRLPLTVTQEATVFFRPHVAAMFAPERFPIFIEHASDAYGFPVFGLPGVKVAFHRSGGTVTGDTRTDEVDPRTVARLRAFLETHLPDAAGPVIQEKSCLYTTTPTEDFVIARHPASARVVVTSPCSGHGFKFMPLVGRLVADLVQDVPGATLPDRFALPRPLGG